MDKEWRNHMRTGTTFRLDQYRVQAGENKCK